MKAPWPFFQHPGLGMILRLPLMALTGGARRPETFLVLKVDRRCCARGGSPQIDPKATLRGRGRSELAAVLGAVTVDALTLEGPIGSFSLTSIATQSHIEKARAFTDVYPSRPRGMQTSGPPGGSLPGYCSRFQRA